jgi:hypothetical protein
MQRHVPQGLPPPLRGLIQIALAKAPKPKGSTRSPSFTYSRWRVKGGSVGLMARATTPPESATWPLSPGVPQSLAMKISGHKTVAMFNRYKITSDDDLRAAAVAVGKGYEAPVSPL